MSAFSEYAARTERSAATYRFNAAAQLTEYHDALATEFPVSGDMLAVLRQGTTTQRRRRRQRARGQQ